MVEHFTVLGAAAFSTYIWIGERGDFEIQLGRYLDIKSTKGMKPIGDKLPQVEFPFLQTK